MQLPEEHYAAAFTEFTGARQADFTLRTDGHHARVILSGTVYRVSHSGDFAAEYRDWFNRGHDLLFTEFPAELWNCFLDHMKPSADDFLIDLYEAWKDYWHGQAETYEKPENYARDMDLAHTRFELLCDKLRRQEGRPVELAWEIDDIQLLPVVALAVKKHYHDDTDFYRACAAWMTSKYQDQVGDGLVFSAYLLPMPGFDSPQAFFIYSINEPF